MSIVSLLSLDEDKIDMVMNIVCAWCRRPLDRKSVRTSSQLGSC